MRCIVLHRFVRTVYEWSPEHVDEAEDFTHEAADLALTKGIDLVVSCTFTCINQMEYYLNRAKALAYSIYVIKASGTYGSIHGVPDATLAAMRESWQDYPGELELPVTYLDQMPAEFDLANLPSRL